MTIKILVSIQLSNPRFESFLLLILTWKMRLERTLGKRYVGVEDYGQDWGSNMTPED